MNNSNFFVCDIGKKQITAYDNQNQVHSLVTIEEFLLLDIPGLDDGTRLVIEDAHLRARGEDSLAQTYTIDQLIDLKNLADKRNITILCFPQKVTPKARKIFSVLSKNADGKLIKKSDENDTQSIAFYLENFPNVFATLKKFNPIDAEKHEIKNTHIYEDRNLLTEDSNEARNNKYGIGKDNTHEDAVSRWIKTNVSKLYGMLDQETRDFFKLELNSKGNGLKSNVLNYIDAGAGTLKPIYNVINTILRPNGDLRVRSDRAELDIDEDKKVPHWKYAKVVYFGITPYHTRAGVTASNYKWHKRKAGNKNKISMAFEENGNPKEKTFESFEDLETIRKEMRHADKCLQKLWTISRGMIITEFKKDKNAFR
tara:strand:+ start:374 stop:1480 length:1107 start_codon:yes stop_codon:yes gene_type:complete